MQNVLIVYSLRNDDSCAKIKYDVCPAYHFHWKRLVGLLTMTRDKV